MRYVITKETFRVCPYDILIIGAGPAGLSTALHLAKMSPHLAQRTLVEKMALAIARISCYHVTVIQSFKDIGTEAIFNGENTKAARKICPTSLWKIAARKLDQIDSVTALYELKIPPGNKLESLSGNRIGLHSIRINDQYRICFMWTDSGPDQVEIVDYH
jgi:proteic killer suppression protein